MPTLGKFRCNACCCYLPPEAMVKRTVGRGGLQRSWRCLTCIAKAKASQEARDAEGRNTTMSNKSEKSAARLRRIEQVSSEERGKT